MQMSTRCRLRASYTILLQMSTVFVCPHLFDNDFGLIRYDLLVQVVLDEAVAAALKVNHLFQCARSTKKQWRAQPEVTDVVKQCAE